MIGLVGSRAQSEVGASMSEQDRSGYRDQFIGGVYSRYRNKKNAAYNRLVEKYKTIELNANRKIVVEKINNLRTTYKKVTEQNETILTNLKQELRSLTVLTYGTSIF